MAFNLHPLINGGVSEGDSAFSGGKLRCYCSNETVEVTIDGNVAHNHACGCSKCWKPQGALFSIVGVVPRDKLSVTAHESKLRVVDESATIQRYACTECGVHLFGRIEKDHPFKGLDFVHIELSNTKGWQKPQFAAFVSSILEQGFPAGKIGHVRTRLNSIGLDTYDALSPPLMDLIAAWDAEKTFPASSNGITVPKGYDDSGISRFRSLVPLVSDGSVTYLNASLAPPSNLIVHGAITKFASEALYESKPKPQWQATVEEARKLVARYINTDSSTIAFTRDTTEALGSFIRGVRFKPGDNVVLLDSEHPNHVYQWMSLRAAGLEVRQVPTIKAANESGKVVAANAATFAPYVDERTVAIGLSSIMFHSGQWNDVAEIASVYRRRNIHVVADITQQVGFATVDVQKLGVSAAAFSLHKGLNCPTGFAVLHVDPQVIRNLDPTPPIVGYGAVSNVRSDLLVPADPITYHPSARRYEHLNLNLISASVAKTWIGFYLDVLGPENVEKHLFCLGDALREVCSELGVKVVGPTSHKEHAPHLYILDLHDPKWLEHFNNNSIIATPYRLGVRVSFGFYNNLDDVKKLASVLRSGVDAGYPH